MIGFLIGLGIYLIVWVLATIYFKWLTVIDPDYFRSGCTGMEVIAGLIWPISLPITLIDRITDRISYVFKRREK